MRSVSILESKQEEAILSPKGVYKSIHITMQEGKLSLHEEKATIKAEVSGHSREKLRIVNFE